MNITALQMVPPPIAAKLASIQRQLAATYDVLRGSSIALDNYDPEDHGPLISYSGLPGYEEVERYWVDAPYAFVSINHDPEANEHLYFVVEPELDSGEIALLDNLVTDLRDTLIHRRRVGEQNTERVIRSELQQLLGEYGVSVDMNTFYRFLYYL
ncbi:MAG: type II secretion system protein, partial [Halobacteriales archaeon]|nr:type II secretion system protein [Halobacteriales archaeon]